MSRFSLRIIATDKFDEQDFFVYLSHLSVFICGEFSYP
jgi:hypothetical protein